ncbi:hypothetical protein BU24DRAFT_425160 [Aaosphaeria arxii CBS 175.79]|uniref:Pre-rRNA-processing protein RIX1 n=1 Tax=Aaosphaeria arxii CBS 175.79 TaxID=1450172 RepID=A0A6A5XH04_9PLEO|nr:uncharacterized protein BU24DRAFT_425160 [Aaosphaeria arxii CBS 175.79]KAF2012515.1 hypothetical protein BU24DRAFT_425160 [Aaosphaeria arxii CBS 175.79]
MAKAAVLAAELSILKAVTFRLSTIPTSQLPQQIPAIAASLANCKTLLSSTQSSSSKASSESSLAIHKYRTFLSTLLQDRTVHGRWAAIVLVKATIEAGGWETLSKSLPWVRGLLGILNRPDPPSSKKLCVITLTRIFVLTRDHQTMKREITTPSLPSFIQACMQIASSKTTGAGLLQLILESFNQLLPWHPTLFRTYVKQIQQLIRPLIAPTPSNKLGAEQQQRSVSESSSVVCEAARQLFCQLPSCAQKGGGSEEWAKNVNDTVLSLHRTADQVLRSVIEDWTSSGRSGPSVGQPISGEVQELEQDALALPLWTGLHAGSERIVGLLRLLKQSLMTPTPAPVSVRLSTIIDLITRFLSLTVPNVAGSKNGLNAVRVNNQVSKEERDILWSILPNIHVATVEVLLALVERFGAISSALDSVLLDQLVWVFGAEKVNTEIRTVVYSMSARLLRASGVTLPKSSVDSLTTLIRSCCIDILPTEISLGSQQASNTQGKASTGAQSANAETYSNSSTNTKDALKNYRSLRQAACDLLPVLLTSIRAEFLSHSTRTLLDRTAILSQHKDAMIASTLNPLPGKKFGKPGASILPLVARSYAADGNVETLLRPRMPVIRVGSQNSEDDDGDEEMEDSSVENEEIEGERFVGEELDALLGTAAEATETVTAVPDVASTESQALSPKPSTPNAINEDKQVTSSLGTSGSKRPPNENGVSSPTKRLKIETEEEIIAPLPVMIPVTVAASSGGVTEAPLVAPAQIQTTQQQPSVSNAAEEESDGDDDFGELVLGQDSDDESD